MILGEIKISIANLKLALDCFKIGSQTTRPRGPSKWNDREKDSGSWGWEDLPYFCDQLKIQ